MNLTPAQTATITDVQIARAMLDAVKAAHAVQIADVSAKIDAAVMRAADAGVPMSRIAHDGLGTTHRNAAYEAIERARAFDFLLQVDAEIAADLEGSHA